MAKLLKCCGEKWGWKEVGYFGQGIDKDLLVFCPLCGNYQRRTEGQMDVEEIWQWLGISDKKQEELNLLDEQIDSLTEQRQKIFVEFYKEL